MAEMKDVETDMEIRDVDEKTEKADGAEFGELSDDRAIARLHEMGVPNFLVASAIEAVLAQRLVRRVCKDCKEPMKPTAEMVKIFEDNKIDISKATFYKGRGCGTCNLLGYKGRAALHEFLIVNNEIRALCLTEVAAGPIRALAVKNGMRTIFLDGLMKVAMGVTTLEEVYTVATSGE